MLLKLFVFTLLFLTSLHASLSKDALSGNMDGVKLALEQGAFVDEITGLYKQTPLLLAVFEGNYDIAKYLIKNHADINAKSSSGKGVLNYALANNNLEFFKYALSMGAKLDYQDKNSVDLFSYAVIKKKLAFAKELLGYKKFDVNTLFPHANSVTRPLLVAVLNDDFEMVKFLVANGADVNGASSMDETPLLLATKYADKEIADFLIKNGAKLDAKDKLNDTVLGYAIIHKDDELFAKAVNNTNIGLKFSYKIFDNSLRGTITLDDFNREANKNEFGYLHLAARYGTSKMVQTLLSKNMDIEELSSGYYHYSPIAIAAFYHNYETFKALFDSGANIYKKFQGTNQHQIGLGYWLGGGDAYTPLGLSITGEAKGVDKRITELILKQKDFAKFVSLEDENFYQNFYILTKNEPKSIYEKVLKRLDDAGFKKSDALQKRLAEIDKKIEQEVSSQKKELLVNDELFKMLNHCKNENEILAYIKTNKINLKNIHKKSNYYQLPLLPHAVAECSSGFVIDLIHLGADVNEKVDDNDLIKRIFDIGKTEEQKELIAYLLKNHKQFEQTFKNKNAFNSFLFSAYDEGELFDKFIKNGVTIEKDATPAWYLKSEKSKRMLFKTLDMFPPELLKETMDTLIAKLLNRNINTNENIEYLMEYAYVHKIAFDADWVLSKSISLRDFSLASRALIFGADRYAKNAKGDTPCMRLLEDRDPDKNMLKEFCKEGSDSLGFLLKTDTDKSKAISLIKEKNELEYQRDYFEDFLKRVDFSQDEKLNMELFDAFLENIDATRKESEDLLKIALGRCEDVKFDIVIQKLIFAKINPNLYATFQKEKVITPLIWSIKFNKSESFKFLLASGADVNYAPNDLASPLNHAYFYDRLDMFRDLVSKNVKMYDKESAKYPSFFSINIDFMLQKYLGYAMMKNDALYATTLNMLNTKQDLAYLQILIDSKQFDLNNKSAQYLNTIVYENKFLDSKRKIEILKLFLDNDADINQRFEVVSKTKKYSYTPLFIGTYWIETLDIDILKFFIANKADVNQADQDGDTPLHNLVYLYKNIKESGTHQEKLETIKEAMKLLIDAGANKNIKNAEGRSVEDLMNENGIEL